MLGPQGATTTVSEALEPLAHAPTRGGRVGVGCTTPAHVVASDADVLVVIGAAMLDYSDAELVLEKLSRPSLPRLLLVGMVLKLDPVRP